MAADPNAVFEFQIIVKIPATVPLDASNEDQDAAWDTALDRVTRALDAANLDWDVESGDWYHLDA
jgi:hypothetical protein